MRYIRFLKTPRIVQDKNPTKRNIFCPITITSDLGDSFLPYDLTLSVELFNTESDKIILWRTIQWTAGMRSLPITLPLSKSQEGSSLQVRVGVEPKTQYDEFATLLEEDRRGVVSAWSAPLNPRNGINEARKSVVRRFRVHDEIYSIEEETGESIARHLWDAGIALSCHIGPFLSPGGSLHQALTRPPIPKRFQVLELGSGCGMVGITLARILLEADILLTDLPEAQEIIETNLKLAKAARKSTLRFQELNWDDDLPADFNNWTDCSVCRQIDLIVAADCTYNSDSSPALVSTMRRVAMLSPHVTVAIAMKMRHPSEEVFFELMAQAQFKIVDKITFSLPGDEEAGEETVQLYIYHFEGETTLNGDINEGEKCKKHR